MVREPPVGFSAPGEGLKRMVQTVFTATAEEERADEQQPVPHPASPNQTSPAWSPSRGHPGRELQTRSHYCVSSALQMSIQGAHAFLRDYPGLPKDEIRLHLEKGEVIPCKKLIPENTSESSTQNALWSSNSATFKRN